MTVLRRERIAAIAIGRNEGVRLVRCLASLRGEVAPIIYVDSGSTDGSVDVARAAGAEVVELETSIPFTAARARNAGLARLIDLDPDGTLVQFLDGDCELRIGWLDAAWEAISASPDIAVVCGRRRERYPLASIWNRLVDLEWDTPVGEVRACGGDALMRREALTAVAGYRDDLIAGEEPEMCARMRANGWRILRIASEMTWHDAAMQRFGQWWKRSQRAGHAFAEVSTLHRSSYERIWIVETRRALIWGAGVPGLAVIAGLVAGPIGLLALLAYPAQVIRLRGMGYDWTNAFFTTLIKVPQALGIFGYWYNLTFGRRRKLIEYK